MFFLNVCQIMKYLFQQIVSKSEISSQAFQKLYNENWLWPYNMEAIRVLYPFLCVVPRSSLNPGGAIFWSNIECVLSLVEAGKRWELQCSGPCSPACWPAWSFQVASWQACFVWSDLINLLDLVWSGYLAGLLDLIIGLDLANFPRLVGWVDLVAWLMNLINLVDLVSRNQALALGSVLRGDLFSSSRGASFKPSRLPGCWALWQCQNWKTSDDPKKECSRI